MRVLKQLAFCLGLVVGLGTIAAAGTVLLTYLFTGKLVSFEMVDEKPKATLMTSDEVIALVKKQMAKGKPGAVEGKGGESNEA